MLTTTQKIRAAGVQSQTAQTNYLPAHYKRFPAFGKKLMAMRIDGQVPGNGVYVVFDWKLARAFLRVVMPDGIAPDRLELRFLAGLDVVLAYKDEHANRVPDLAREVLKVNPRILNAIAIDIPQNVILKNLAGEVLL